MTMIRWTGLIAFTVIFGVIVLLTLVFLDGIVKHTFERRVGSAIGSQVDIGDLDIELFGLHIDIRNLRITNPENPLRNIIEIHTISCDIATAPLLKKKLIIEKMAVQDLAFDTARESPGKLYRQSEKEMKGAHREDTTGRVPEPLAECKLLDPSALAQVRQRSPKDLLEDVDLASEQFLADHRKKIADTRQLWEKRLKELPSQESLGTDLRALRALLKQKPRDAAALPAYLNEIHTSHKKIVGIRQTLTTAENDFQRDIDDLQTALSADGIEKLKEFDLEKVIDALNLRVPSSEDFVWVLVGNNIARKVQTAISWYRTLRTIIPAGPPEGEKETPRSVRRMRGVDVRYPATDGYPDILLKRTDISARPGAAPEPEKITFTRLAGDIRGFTTQPAAYGEPLRFTVEGKFAGEVMREASLSGQLDHRKSPANDIVTLNIKEVRIREKDPEEDEKALPVLSSASLNVTSSFSVKGNAIKGRVLLIALDPRIHVGPEARIFESLFRNIGNFDIIINVGSTLDNPTMTLSSSLTGPLDNRLKGIVDRKLDILKTGLKEAIAARLDDEIISATNDITSLETTVLKTLTERINITDTILREASGEEAKKCGTAMDFSSGPDSCVGCA